MTGEEKIKQLKKIMSDFIRNANSITSGLRSEGGGEKIQKWQENFDPMSLNPLIPIFRTLEGTDHTIFAIDTDVKIMTKYVEELKTVDEIRKMKLNAVMTFWEEWSKKHPEYKFFDYVSGKGMYRIQRCDKPIPKTHFLEILWGTNKKNNGILKKSEGFKISKNGSGIENKITIDNVEYKIIIDLALYKKGRHVFRIPYSAYLKHGYQTFYCVPVVKDKEGNFDKEETIKRTELRNLVVENIIIPSFQFNSRIIKEVSTNTISRYQRIGTLNKRKVSYRFNIPEPDEKLTKKQIEKLDEMRKLVSNPNPKFTPPCIYNAWMRRDEHWMKVILLRYLASLRYKDSYPRKEYSWNDLALFFRFMVNDEEDNLPKNKNRLFSNIITFLRDPHEPDKPSGCIIYQDKEHQYYCCDPIADASRCQRNYCLFKQPQPNIIRYKQDKQDEEEKNEVGFEEITNLASQMVMLNKNLEVIKTTRAGVTTTLIRAAVFHNKKILAVVPTTEIARSVFGKALRLVYKKYGEKIDGAVLSSNIKSCLKLKFTLEDLRKKKEKNPDWGQSSDIEWEKLPFHSKPSCVVMNEGRRRECEYYHDLFDFPHRRKDGTPYAIIEADATQYQIQQVKQGYCAYQTVMQKIANYDVIFITYDKLAAMLLNTEAEAREFIELIENIFDIIFLDEVSTLVQSSPLTITMYEQIVKDINGTSQVEIHYEDFCSQLYAELSKLDKPPNMFEENSFEPYSTHTMDMLRQITTDFISAFDRFIREKRFSGEFDRVSCWKIENFLLKDGRERLEEFREMFFAFYSLLSNYTKRTNERLNALIKMIILLQSDTWWLQSTPVDNVTEKKISANFVTSPKIQKITDFVERMNWLGKQIIVTDATMPLVKMSDIFRIDFERFVVGDPRNTCNKQLVITDTITKSVRDLLERPKKGETMNENQKNLISLINKVCTAHGTENVLVVVPNSRSTTAMLIDMREKGLIPRVHYTWYRSSQTIGVEKKERVMICICPPTPPRNSSLWLANFYHEQGLFIDSDDESSVSHIALSKKLEQMNEHQSFYQTIGRVKDPEAEKFSVVYCWGISYKKIKEIIQMDDDVPIPHIVNTHGLKNSNDYMTMIGKAWTKFGVILDTRFIKIYQYLERVGSAPITTLTKKAKCSLDYIKELIHSQDVLQYFGIEVVTDKVTQKIYFLLQPTQ